MWNEFDELHPREPVGNNGGEEQHYIESDDHQTDDPNFREDPNGTGHGGKDKESTGILGWVEDGISSVGDGIATVDDKIIEAGEDAYDFGGKAG